MCIRAVNIILPEKGRKRRHTPRKRPRSVRFPSQDARDRETHRNRRSVVSRCPLLGRGGGEGNGSDPNGLMGMEVSFRGDENVLESEGRDGCTTRQTY